MAELPGNEKLTPTPEGCACATSSHLHLRVNVTIPAQFTAGFCFWFLDSVSAGDPPSDLLGTRFDGFKGKDVSGCQPGAQAFAFYVHGSGPCWGHASVPEPLPSAAAAFPVPKLSSSSENWRRVRLSEACVNGGEMSNCYLCTFFFFFKVRFLTSFYCFCQQTDMVACASTGVV